MTKMQLLNEVEVLKFENSGQQETIVLLRNANLKLYGEVYKLHAELSKTRAAFEAYKVGARTFHKLAEAQIAEGDVTATGLKLKLINSQTAGVYCEAKKGAGI
jgi:hypothetical protein